MKALVYSITPARWIYCRAAGLFSKRAFYGAGSALRLMEKPVPELPGPGWVRLKTILGGICGTDLGMITQRTHPATMLRSFSSFPAILGHENVAVIDAVASGVTSWKAGQRVCVEPAVGCVGRGVTEPCAQCAAGRSSLCEYMGNGALPSRALVGLNTQTGGSWAEFFVAHQSQLHAVPAGIPDEIAILIDPIASAAHAVLRRPPRNGERVLINGSGIIALGIIGALRALGHANETMISVRHEFIADLARKLGVTHVISSPRTADSAARYDNVARHVHGRRVEGRFGNQGMIGGFDLTYDCTGSGSGLTDALKWTRSRGTLVAVGTSGITLLDTTPIWFDELEIVGANGRQIETTDGRTVHTYDLVFEWLQSGKLDLSVLPVGRFALADYRTAFDHLLGRARHPIVKAVLAPDGR